MTTTTTTTPTPHLGDRMHFESPAWNFTGIVTKIAPERTIVGHDGTNLVWETSTDRFEITLAGTDYNGGVMTTTVTPNGWARGWVNL